MEEQIQAGQLELKDNPKSCSFNLFPHPNILTRTNSKNNLDLCEFFLQAVKKVRGTGTTGPPNPLHLFNHHPLTAGVLVVCNQIFSFIYFWTTHLKRRAVRGCQFLSIKLENETNIKRRKQWIISTLKNQTKPNKVAV